MDELEKFAGTKGLTPVRHFTVLHPGWECDSHGLVAADKEGKFHAILTDHGSPYVADKSEVSSQVVRLQMWLREAEEVERLLLG